MISNDKTLAPVMVKTRRDRYTVLGGLPLALRLRGEASLRTRVPIPWLLLVRPYHVHDDLFALFAKHDRERKTGNAQSPAAFFVWFACTRVASNLRED